MAMKGELPLVNGDEVDVFSRWRHAHCWTARTGATDAVKRRYRRRVRRYWKDRLRFDRE